VAIYSEVTRCRCCSNALDEVWDGGEQYVVRFPKLEENREDMPRVPLVLMVCSACGLVQLKHSVDSDAMFHTFWYRSGTNEMMRVALRDVVEKSMRYVDLQEGDIVVDIGCNDGTLFQYYGDKKVRKIGFDPAKNIQSPGMQRGGWEFICDYFNAGTYRSYLHRNNVFKKLKPEKFKPAKLITACAMFYDLENPKEFLRQVANILDPNGVFVVQMNYLGTMLKNRCIDNVSHEHLCYYSLRSFVRLLADTSLSVFAAELNDVNGGSIRIYLSLKSKEARGDGSAHKIVSDEISELDALLSCFPTMVKCLTVDIHRKLYELSHKETIYAYGASTRGTSLLQLLGDVSSMIQAVAERDPSKYGRMMVGSWIPIVSEEDARKKATVFFVLPYHFLPTILKREKEWMKNGGKLFVPLPNPRLISWRDVMMNPTTGELSVRS